MDLVNHQFRLAARPVGLPKPSDWEYTEEPVPELGDGEALVKVLYLSLDPAMRGWMNDARSYIAPVGIGETMRAGGIGEVLVSNHPDLAPGDLVTGMLGVQDYAVAHGNAVTKLDVSLAPLPIYLGTLGMPGLTAYFGLLDIGKPQEGETVVVSGAAGAVGGVVGQIAKLRAAASWGSRVEPRSVATWWRIWALTQPSTTRPEMSPRACASTAPKGIDVYFDNVGGEILDHALAGLARHARVIICGAISQYNATGAVQGPSNYLSLLVNNASMTGFVIFDYADRYAEGLREMGGWFAAGKLVSREDIAEGLESFPDTLLRLFSGENTGKLVLKLTTD